MKKTAIIISLIWCGLVVAMAQQGKSREAMREEVQNLKIAYITEALELTSAESEKFWPIYNQYWQERERLAHQQRSVYNRIDDNLATQSDINALVKTKQDEAALISKFAAQIAKITSVDKAAKTFVAEEKFKSFLLRRTRGHGQQKSNE